MRTVQEKFPVTPAKPHVRKSTGRFVSRVVPMLLDVLPLSVETRMSYT
jgi:hypothetical protein